MSEYLFRVSLKPSINWVSTMNRNPKAMYVVERSKEGAKEYAAKHLKRGFEVKSVTFCGERLGMNMYHGGKIS